MSSMVETTKNTNPISLDDSFSAIESLKHEISRAIFGQEELLTEAIACLLGGGHLLVTGAPGLAKTTLVRVFANTLGLKFGRVQFTPDLLPTDIIGSEILNIDDNQKRSFEFAKGPVFVNLLLADEINRASPRTQSALLEAMQERCVTVNGVRHILPQPFLVFATQNPFESEGTFPLPEAQLDRFLLHTLVSYPSMDAELKLLEAHATTGLVGEKLNAIKPDFQLNSEILLALMERAKSIRVEKSILGAVADLVRMTRPEDGTCPENIRKGIWYGAGPRAGISLITAAKSFALMQKSEVVRWSHVKRMAKPVLRHRIRLNLHSGRDGLTEDQVVDMLVDRLQVEKTQAGIGLE